MNVILPIILPMSRVSSCSKVFQKQWLFTLLPTRNKGCQTRTYSSDYFQYKQDEEHCSQTFLISNSHSRKSSSDTCSPFKFEGYLWGLYVHCLKKRGVGDGSHTRRASAILLQVDSRRKRSDNRKSSSNL